MPRATSNSLFAGTPAPPKPAAAPPPVQLPRDENAPYLGPDGQLCIGQPMPPRKIQSPYLYIEKLLLDNSKTLDGSKEGHALRLELLPLSRQMVIGYVAAGEGSEEEKGKTIRHELTLSYKTLRSAKVEVVRLTEKGGSDVKLVFEYVAGATIKTATCIIDTREISRFDSYALERIKSGLQEWAIKGLFACEVSLIKALPIPLPGSSVVHHPPPPSFNPADPNTWSDRFSYKPKPKASKSKKGALSNGGPAARHSSPADRERPDDDGDYVEGHGASSKSKKKRKSRPSTSLREPTSSDEMELLGARRDSEPAPDSADEDYAEPGPSFKKAKSAPKKKGGAKSTARAAPDPIDARFAEGEARLEAKLEAKFGAKIAQLSVEAGKVPGLEDTVARQDGDITNLQSEVKGLKAVVKELEKRLS